MPRGGRRAGSGRKPKSAEMRELDGNAGHRPARVLNHPSGASAPAQTAPPPVEEFDAPNDLTTDERNVWVELAPHAFAARTLTKGTAEAFKMLCRNVLLEKEMRASVLDRGRPAHQGLIGKVENGYLKFALAPCGKPMYDAAPKAVAVNPLEKFLSRG
jgi:hypothetical protein